MAFLLGVAICYLLIGCGLVCHCRIGSASPDRTLSIPEMMISVIDSTRHGLRVTSLDVQLPLPTVNADGTNGVNQRAKPMLKAENVENEDLKTLSSFLRKTSI